jgi:TolB-like protein/Flp pilus assembly protein TadD
MSFIKELKRRNVIRVAIAYGVAAWLLIEITATTFPILKLPNWSVTLVTVLVLIGFPLALILAWAFELTPEGLKKEKDVDRSESITHVTGRKLDFIIIAVLVLALGYFAYDKFVLDASRDAVLVEATTQDVTEKVVTEQEVSTESDKSIAVLPFVNMSEDAENEYFADGLSEELLNMLVKIPGLKVAARTSSFSFKGKGLTISEIARKLGVNNVLEGSVRKSGNRVRITAQLIKADDGFHLWSESYDRTLDDIFATQDEIALAVTGALKVTLMGEAPKSRPTLPAVFELYLQGLQSFRVKGEKNWEKAVAAFTQAVQLDPEYAPAWNLLGATYSFQTAQGLRPREEGLALARAANDRALAIDPEYGGAWASLGHLKKFWEWEWEAAEEAISKARRLDPHSASITIAAASMATTLGQLDKAIALYEQARILDPIGFVGMSALGQAYMRVRRFDDAISMLEQLAGKRPDYIWDYSNLGLAHLLNGDAERALIEIDKNLENEMRDFATVMAYSTLGREQDAQLLLAKVTSDAGEFRPTRVAESHSWRGETDLAFEWLEKAREGRDPALSYVLGNVFLENLVGDPRWPVFLNKLDLLEAWQAMPPEYGGPPY